MLILPALDSILKLFKHLKNKIGSISNLNIRGIQDLRGLSSKIHEFKMVVKAVRSTS